MAVVIQSTQPKLRQRVTIVGELDQGVHGLGAVSRLKGFQSVIKRRGQCRQWGRQGQEQGKQGGPIVGHRESLLERGLAA